MGITSLPLLLGILVEFLDLPMTIYQGKEKYLGIIFASQEHEKIVLYVPAGEDLDKKIKNVGLCEALVKFTQ